MRLQNQIKQIQNKIPYKASLTNIKFLEQSFFVYIQLYLVHLCITPHLCADRTMVNNYIVFYFQSRSALFTICNATFFVPTNKCRERVVGKRSGRDYLHHIHLCPHMSPFRSLSVLSRLLFKKTRETQLDANLRKYNIKSELFCKTLYHLVHLTGRCLKLYSRYSHIGLACRSRNDSMKSGITFLPRTVNRSRKGDFAKN